MSATTNDVPFREGLAFLAPLLEQSARDLAYTTNALIDSLALECAESAARLQLAEEAFSRLWELPYMPSPDAIWRCFRPTTAGLKQRTEEILHQRGIHSSTHVAEEADHVSDN